MGRCDRCACPVFDAKALSPDALRAALRVHQGEVWVRSDGTLMTTDCPRGSALRRASSRTGSQEELRRLVLEGPARASWLKRGAVVAGVLLVVSLLAVRFVALPFVLRERHRIRVEDNFGGLRGDDVIRPPRTFEQVIASMAAATDGIPARDVREAQRLIALEKEPGRKSWYQGELNEVLGEPGAVGLYAAAARLGLSPAEARLLDLLKHRQCEVRSAAAAALGALRLARANDGLLVLAHEGGADDGLVLLGFGCDSRKAGADALELLKP